MVTKSQPLFYSLPNNQTFDVLQPGQGLTLTEIEITITALVVQAQIEYNRQNIPDTRFYINVDSDVVIKFHNADITTFLIDDPNNYNYYIKISYLTFDNQKEYLDYLEKFDFDIHITPQEEGNNVIINTTANPVPVNISEITSYRNAINASSFTQTLTTANTKQVLNSVIAYNFVKIINLSPSDTIYIGDINNQIIPISPNTVLSIDLQGSPLNLNSLYWIGATASTDKIGVVYA